MFVCGSEGLVNLLKVFLDAVDESRMSQHQHIKRKKKNQHSKKIFHVERPCHVKLYFVCWSVDNQEMPNPQCEIIMIGQLLSVKVLLEEL